MRAARLIASGFGVGFVPAAPGTAGSVLGLALGAALLALSPAALALGAVGVTAVGLWAIERALIGETAHDPGWIVIDEVAGQMVALLGAAWRPSWAGLLFAFALFRLFDIAKPGPVRWADRRSAPVFVMADDLIAGGLAAGGTAILLTAIALKY
jgi:phosphatidylglycerophosphatase A